MDNEELDIKLIGWISGEVLSTEEREELDRWIHASEENFRYYEHLQLAYLRQRWIFRERLVQRKGEKRYRRVAARRMSLRWALSGAAAVVIVLSGVLFFRTADLPEKSLPLAGTGFIQPVNGIVELYLSSGVVVPLGKEHQLIEEKNQQTICVQEEGSLNYQKETLVKPMEATEPIFNTLSVGRGGEYRIVLSDSSVVWLNSASELEYPVCFRAKRRVVKLKGEAYFQVRADCEHPFVVISGGVEVMAVGTEFNVNTHRQGRVETTLLKGCVAVSKDDRQVILRPAEAAVYHIDQRLLKVERVNPDMCVAWRNGDIVFSDERLEDILEELALWYDFDVFYRNAALKDILLSGDMKRYGKIEELLHFFERSAGLRFDIKGKTITVCEK